MSEESPRTDRQDGAPNPLGCAPVLSLVARYAVPSVVSMLVMSLWHVYILFALQGKICALKPRLAKARPRRSQNRRGIRFVKLSQADISAMCVTGTSIVFEVKRLRGLVPAGGAAV